MSADAAVATGPVRVAIFGCGLIGARWDQPGGSAADDPTPRHSLTHAAAFSRQAGAQIVGFCDPDLSKAEEAVARWGCGQAHADPAALLAATQPELVVVATHSSVRLAVIEPALAAGVRSLVIEKPLAGTLEEAGHILHALDARGATALVNYSRHWDPALEALRQRIAAGELGRVQRLVGLYGKGLSNNGSHMIDLAGLLCDARPVRARALGSPLPTTESDWSQCADRAIDGQVVYGTRRGDTVQLDLLATDPNAYSCFELKLIGTAAICEIRLGGRRIEWQPIQPDPDFDGYRVPGPRTSLVARNLEALDTMAAEAVAMARAPNPRVRCDARNALATAATVDALRRSAASESPLWMPIAA